MKESLNFLKVLTKLYLPLKRYRGVKLDIEQENYYVMHKIYNINKE